MSRLVIVGSGGHAKVVIATARAAGMTDVVVVDDDPARHGKIVLGHHVEGASGPVLDDPDALVVLAIGDNRVRQRLASSARCRFATLVHPRALVDPSVQLGAGTVVMAGAIVQPDARIGGHVIVNTAATIDHDGVVGDFAHVGPGAHLAGHVTLGEGVLVGTAAAIVPGARVADWATVSAGSAVVGALPAAPP